MIEAFGHGVLPPPPPPPPLPFPLPPPGICLGVGYGVRDITTSVGMMSLQNEKKEIKKERKIIKNIIKVEKTSSELGEGDAMIIKMEPSDDGGMFPPMLSNLNLSLNLPSKERKFNKGKRKRVRRKRMPISDKEADLKRKREKRRRAELKALFCDLADALGMVPERAGKVIPERSDIIKRTTAEIHKLENKLFKLQAEKSSKLAGLSFTEDLSKTSKT